MKKTRRIAQRIAFFRAEAGLTPADLARALGVTGAAVSHWEGGGPGPKLANLERIAKVCGVPVSKLLGEGL